MWSPSGSPLGSRTTGFDPGGLELALFVPRGKLVGGASQIRHLR
jgi:hypothetical protein